MNRIITTWSTFRHTCRGVEWDKQGPVVFGYNRKCSKGDRFVETISRDRFGLPFDTVASRITYDVAV